MISVDSVDEQFLRRSIEHGEVVIVLGAGASFESKNKSGGNVKLGGALAKLVAEEAGFPYAGEPLATVLTAVKPILGEARLLRIYQAEFGGIESAADIVGLGRFTWRRLYTWSIDDALNNSLKVRNQRLYFYNGMSDAVVENNDLAVLQSIKLHGDILHPDKGFIMTETDYAAALGGGSHSWYRKAAQDYVSYTPVFIGSRLAEPILSAEIERAKRSATEETGRGFVITPDVLSQLESSALRAKGLVHIKGTLRDFISWMDKSYPNGITPKDVLGTTNSFISSDLNDKITVEDLEIARSIFPKDMVKISARAAGASSVELNREARRFLRGFPPNWDVAASNIPVWLTPTTELFSKMFAAINDRARMFVVTGQAGSGKTTATLQSLVRFGRENPTIPIYEITGDVRSVRRAFALINRLHDGQAIVYISDLFVFGDSLVEDIDSLDRGRITIIATARKGEWMEHLERRFGIVAKHEYSRFTRNDYQPLIDRLVEFVPAPTFKALGPTQRLEKLSRSREQLLIALREATSSQNFSDIITNEYESLPDEDSRALLIIIGIATVARVGIDPGTAREAYARVSRRRSFEDAEKSLDGIVSRLSNGRLFARHELYVRHIIDDVATLDFILNSLMAISSTFTKYPIPVVKSVNKIDAALFRFCWNHKFVFEQCRRRDRLQDGELVYSTFEIDFQLDGHFWLQYGLYLSECKKPTEALQMMKKSIEAYPNNSFAVHAYAELQLQAAYNRTVFDTVARTLIDEAVVSLENLDARRDKEFDQYPLVTLANLHIGALLRHGETKAARTFASNYFDRLQQMERRVPFGRITSAKERMFRYLTLGEWQTHRHEAANPDKVLRGRRRFKPNARDR